MYKKTLRISLIVLLLMICCTPLVTRQLSPELVLKLFSSHQPSLNNTYLNKFAKPEISSYLEYLNQVALKPTDYIVSKFQEKDLVILSENHWVASHTDFVAELVNPLVQAGVRDFAFEFSNRQMQKLIDVFLSKPEPDMALLYEVFSEEFDIFGWPFSGYIQLFVKLHQVNQRLKKDNDRLFIHLVDAPLRVDYPRQNIFRDQHMAKEISLLLNQGKKVLFHCGAAHGSVKVVSKKSKKKFITAGSLLYDEFKNKIFSVKLHYPYGENFVTGEAYPFANALFDRILSEYGKEAGFDLNSGPFAQIKGGAVHDLFFFLGSEENKLTDAWQGYIFPTTESKPKFGGIEEDMFNQGFVQRKLEKDSPIFGMLVNLLFSPKQLSDACKLYKLKSLHPAKKVWKSS